MAITRAKSIDRLALTRSKFKHLKGSISTPLEQQDSGLKECPNCKSKSLRLDGGCMSCLSCGWSACG